MDDEERQSLEIARQEIKDREYPYLVYRVVDGFVVEYEGAYTRQEAEGLRERMRQRGGEVRFAFKPES